MQRSVINSIIVGLIVFPRLQGASAKYSAAVSGLEEVVVFAVQQEAKASDVKSRRDVVLDSATDWRWMRGRLFQR